MFDSLAFFPAIPEPTTQRFDWRPPQTANPQRGFQLQSQADVPQCPIPQLSMPAVFAVLVFEHLFCGLSLNPQPRKTAEDSHPFGKTVNRGSPSLAFHAGHFRGSGSLVLFPHYPQPRIFPTTRDPSGQSANYRQGFPEIPTGLCPGKLQSRHSQIAKGTPGFLNMPGDR